ncbi:MAG: TatD family hydrolase, partial [Bacteroidales bacterium]|nr:TatD family hydrolase [Bacteroidales bacterium]
IPERWEKDLQTLALLLQQKKCSALGECGLDKLSDTPIELQEKVFNAQITLAHTHHLPLIIHCVKAFDQLLSIRKKHAHSCPMIIHGYRGGTGLTSQLLKENNLFFSFGANYSTESLKMVPPERLFIETDISPLSIITLYRQVASTLQISEQLLAEQILSNKKRVFPL